VVDVADEAAGRLLGADPLAQLAGARLQRFDPDAVLLLERRADVLVEGGTFFASSITFCQAGSVCADPSAGYKAAAAPAAPSRTRVFRLLCSMAIP
jgi:hypothetical protein